MMVVSGGVYYMTDTQQNEWKNNILTPSNRKVLIINIITAFALCLFLEYMERKSLSEVLRFINDRTFVFLYNVLIIFVSLSVVFLAKKKLFTWAAVSGVWFLIGAFNGFILTTRKTPFTAVDFTLAKSTLPVIGSYLKVWQIILLVVFIIAIVILMVTLYLYSPDAKKTFVFRTNMALFILQMIVFGAITYIAVGRGMLISRFDNLIAGYKDYGVAYGFCVTAFDTGIDRPIDYSSDKMQRIAAKVDRKAKKLDDDMKKKGRKKRYPNIIFIQLESFFDPSTVKKLSLLEDPIPNFHRLQKENSSGYLKVPVYGAGTINTEFEVITGMNTAYFGTGEYPYRSILHERTCDSIAYWLNSELYTKTVIHNNNASFYDRDHVLSNLGFDYFLTSENMNIIETNAAGWAKDSILTGEIMDTLGRTPNKDLIYTISVQGHGDYPSDPLLDAPIKVTGEGMDEDYINQLTYYVSQIKEMDDFIGDLINKLSEYPEDTVVVAYGDHLPGMDFSNDDLTSGSKYKTPYFIWDNFGYNSSKKKKESGNFYAWQLAAKIFGQLDIRDGIMNRYHQGMKETKNYRKNLKLVQYDMLYGSDFISKDEEVVRKQTDIQYCMRPIYIKKIIEGGDRWLVYGKNFTQQSRVYAGGRSIKTKYLYPYLLEIPKGSLRKDDEVIVHQVSQTTENITFNTSEPFVYKEE